MSWQSLTPELVFEIFRHFLPDLTLSVTEPELFPWYLGQICGSWRRVVISHAGFWSKLIIISGHCYGDGPLLIRDVQCANRALQLLNLCLCRSSDRPLSFKFAHCLLEPSDSIDQKALSKCYRQMLDLLIGESTRWRDAYISLTGESELPILYKIKNKLPMLRSIRIQLLDADDFITYPPTVYEDLFENAPQLGRLYIEDRPSWHVDWSTLTAIHFWGPSLDEVSPLLDILSRVTVSRLEELTIHGRYAIPIPPDGIPLKTLPFLKILRIDREDALFLFRTEMLQELWIGGSTFSPATGSRYRNTISACLPSLIHLTKLTLFGRLAGQVEILLQYMPPLPDLSLYICNTGCLKLLSECPRSRCLKTLTIGLLVDDEDLWADITTWMKRKSLPDGVRRFEELEYLSLELFEMPSHGHIAVMKEHLEAEGIRHSIQMNHTLNSRFPLFDNWFQW